MIALAKVKGEKVEEIIWMFDTYEHALDYYKMYCRGRKDQKDIQVIPMAGQMYTIK